MSNSTQSVVHIVLLGIVLCLGARIVNEKLTIQENKEKDKSRIESLNKESEKAELEVSNAIASLGETEEEIKAEREQLIKEFDEKIKELESEYEAERKNRMNR